jgi:hypothetical protein
MRLPLLVVSLAAALAAASLAAPAGAALTICHAQAAVPLNVSAAAKQPAVVGGKVAPFGASQAQSLATSFRNGAGDVCSLPATAQVAAQLTVIARLAGSGQTAASRALFRKLLAQIAARHTSSVVRHAAAVKGTPCPADRTVKVKLKNADKVGDYLKAAATAQKAGDAAGAQAAAAAAQAAYDTWATGDKTGATTVGDYIALATGAQKISGNAAVSDALVAKARATAAANLAKASKVDRCTASLKDASCLGSAEVMAELVGASEGLDLGSVNEVMTAIGDRLAHNKLPDGCEEWSFTMKIVDTEAGNWTIAWATGRFRVNRTAQTLDGSQAAGYGPGWPGLIGSYTSDCIETTPDGTTDYGPATIHGAPFRYAIDGSVTDTGFELNVSSAAPRPRSTPRPSRSPSSSGSSRRTSSQASSGARSSSNSSSRPARRPRPSRTPAAACR